MTKPLTNQQAAQLTAIDRAVESLAHVDLAARCAMLQLPALAVDNSLTFRMLGGDLRLLPPEFTATWIAGNAFKTPTVSSADRLLALHYLLCSIPPKLTGELITFRDLPGGNFYFGPFSSRTTKPLAARIHSDLPRLRKNLARFDTTPVTNSPPADLAANIHIVGPLYLTLLYHLPDEESPATAEILFDSTIKHALNTEDIAVLSSRICFALV